MREREQFYTLRAANNEEKGSPYISFHQRTSPSLRAITSLYHNIRSGVREIHVWSKLQCLHRRFIFTSLFNDDDDEYNHNVVGIASVLRAFSNQSKTTCRTSRLTKLLRLLDYFEAPRTALLTLNSNIAFSFSASHQIPTHKTYDFLSLRHKMWLYN